MEGSVCFLCMYVYVYCVLRVPSLRVFNLLSIEEEEEEGEEQNDK